MQMKLSKSQTRFDSMQFRTRIEISFGCSDFNCSELQQSTSIMVQTYRGVYDDDSSSSHYRCRVGLRQSQKSRTLEASRQLEKRESCRAHPLNTHCSSDGLCLLYRLSVGGKRRGDDDNEMTIHSASLNLRAR